MIQVIDEYTSKRKESWVTGQDRECMAIEIIMFLQEALRMGWFCLGNSRLQIINLSLQLSQPFIERSQSSSAWGIKGVEELGDLLDGSRDDLYILSVWPVLLDLLLNGFPLHSNWRWRYMWHRSPTAILSLVIHQSFGIPCKYIEFEGITGTKQKKLVPRQVSHSQMFTDGKLQQFLAEGVFLCCFFWLSLNRRR